jgi:hypothetical protein
MLLTLPLGPALHAQAMSGPPRPACPPAVNPVRNTTIKVYINAHVVLPFNNMSIAQIWSDAIHEDIVDRLNRAASADGNTFVEVSSADSSNVNLDLTVDNSTPDKVHTLKMVSWNSLELTFTAAQINDSSATLALVRMIYPYFHLGYQAGPDACRPWVK